MEISYYGCSAFKVSGKNVSICMDPFDSSKVGLQMPKTESDVVTISHDHNDHNNKAVIKGDFICFDSPGEYEIKETQIVGIKSFHDGKEGAERGLNTIFSFEVDGINLCHLGDLGSDLSTEQIEKINGVDILMIPVGGKYTIDPKQAVKVISEIEPKIILPMHFKAGKMTDVEPIESFLKEIGKTPKKEEKLKIQKKDLPEETEVILLKY